jgi:hypothetical protein
MLSASEEELARQLPLIESVLASGPLPQAAMYHRYAGDPFGLLARLWPDVKLYDKQEQTIDSFERNDETVVVAGKQLGKDFVAGFLCLYSFLTRPVVRVVTTSVKGDHLRILFGEIERFIQTAREPLSERSGGHLVMNHWDIHKLTVSGERCPISYLRGMVSAKGEGMAGHHAPWTVLVIDEASGVEDEVYKQGLGWSKRRLIFGNPNDCSNFFRRAVDGGDILAPDGDILTVRTQPSFA